MTRDPILVDLALQGGGSHGAFTWGVLDRLLEEPWLGIDGISGTSAGAMNAAVLADGYAKAGAAGARMALEKFWRRVSEAARFSPIQRGPLDVLLGRWSMDFSPAYIAVDLISRLFSPYDLNPGGANPLHEILANLVDFERLAQPPIKLFITATNVRTGRGKVFRNNHAMACELGETMSRRAATRCRAMAGADMFSVQGLPYLLCPRRRLSVRAAARQCPSRRASPYCASPVTFGTPSGRTGRVPDYSPLVPK